MLIQLLHEVSSHSQVKLRTYLVEYLRYLTENGYMWLLCVVSSGMKLTNNNNYYCCCKSLKELKPEA